jgi:hypothetical protein
MGENACVCRYVFPFQTLNLYVDFVKLCMNIVPLDAI